MADTRSPFPLAEPPLLLLRPHPGRQEGAQGYRLRLAEANCLTTMELDALGMRFDVDWLQRQQLLPDAQLDPDLYERVAHITRLRDRTGRVWNTRRSRCCPQCLADDPTWQVGWELLFHDVCPRHGVWLIDQCSSCHQPLTWKRTHLLRCPCGSDLREERVQEAPERCRLLAQGLIDALTGRPSAAATPPSPTPASAFPGWLTGLGVTELQRVIRYLGGYLDPGIGPKPLKLLEADRLEVSWPVTTLAAEILGQWPQAFHQSLSRLQEEARDDRKNRHGLFTTALSYPHKESHRGAFSGIRQEISEWFVTCAKTTPNRRHRRLSIEQRLRAPLIPLSQAARKLGVSPRHARQLVREGILEGEELWNAGKSTLVLVHKESLEGAQDYLLAGVSQKDAMQMLGLGKLRMRAMVPLLFPEARRRPGGTSQPWIIPRHSVETLKTLGTALADNGQAPLPVLSIPDEDQASLGYVLRYFNISEHELLALINTVRRGQLVPVALDSSEAGICRWVFTRTAIQAWRENFHRELSDWLSIPEAAVELGSRQDVTYWLMHHQYLPTEKLPGKKGIGVRIPRKTVATFREKYVFATELAAELGVASRKLRRLLEERGIHPEARDSPVPCRQLFYAQSEALALIVRELRDGQAGDFRLTQETCRPPPDRGRDDVGSSRRMGRKTPKIPNRR